MAVGGVIAVAGLIGMLGSVGSDDPADTEAVGVTVAVATDTTTTTTEKETTATTSTPVSTTTSTTAPATTTTTIDVGTSIATFVTEFADAIDRGDIDFLVDSLHPGVIETFGEDLCRTYVGDEILALVDYRLTGDIEGPTSGPFSESMYVAPVTFSFQGQEFEADASFGAEPDGVRWFTECRG